VTEAIAEFLVSEPGAAVLGRGAKALTNAQDLPPELRAGALTILDGRERAHKRGWEEAGQLFLTADALAQASSTEIAAFHAKCFSECESVLDACCGVGRDALALAAAGKRVVAVDTDPARLVFARANAHVLGLEEKIRFVCADVTALEGESGHCEGAFFDPARRDGHTRFSADSERYQPPLSFLESLQERHKIVVAKLSPALHEDTLTSLGGQLLFLSEERTCKEACIVLGGEAGPARALLLPRGESYERGEEPFIADELGEYLLDPDPGVIRAGALGALANACQAALIAPTDMYLTAAEPSLRAAVRSYKVRVALPYRDRTLGRWLREQGIGRLVVKKRHYPKEPEAVHKELGLKWGGKGAEATLVIVAQGKSWLGIVCDPVN
jgi:SAM-dependent methyltransferase